MRTAGQPAPAAATGCPHLHLVLTSSRMPRRLLLACAALAACGPARPPAGPAPTHALPLPPDPAAPPPGLARATAVERALYHADLFDATRLLGDAPSRALLGAELGLAAPP